MCLPNVPYGYASGERWQQIVGSSSSCEKCPSKNAEFGTRNQFWGNLEPKLKFWTPIVPSAAFCRNSDVGKLLLNVALTFLAYDAAEYLYRDTVYV